MSDKKRVVIDGNEAAATIAHLCNEVIAIYPITPASPMGEHADSFSAQGQTNIWGTVPKIVEMQSEGGAAGTIHGSLQAGSLTTTFTASQGLLLMLPDMYKIAGELTPTVFHVAARSIATQALSIFCDHSDVMAARTTGFGIVAANSVQEVMDMALITQAATLEGRVPLIHFFDGFRTSHELAEIEAVDRTTVKAMVNNDWVEEHRKRAMSPEHPVVRGTAQNPDVFFQAREGVNTFYQKMPQIIQQAMDHFSELTGRQYHLFDYNGDNDAERVIVIMGSAAETTHETVEHLNKHNEKVGVVKVHLFRPLDSEALLAAIPKTVCSIAVLDRTKEPGANGEPLYKDVLTAMAEAYAAGDIKRMPKIIGGRYGLSSKEYTPGMVKAIFDELAKDKPKNQFTIGIDDDVTHTSLTWDHHYHYRETDGVIGAVFYGLGADGTISANKNAIKIIGRETDLQTQGYFVYDSKKSGAVTVSHLRFAPGIIRSSYLLGDEAAQFVACHQTQFLERFDILAKADQGASFLLNTPVSSKLVWPSLPMKIQQRIIDKHIKFYIIDAYAIAKKNNLGRRINTIMQACFFAISDIIPQIQAIKAIKEAVIHSYGKRGQTMIDQNTNAIDMALTQMQQIEIPAEIVAGKSLPPIVAAEAPRFVRDVTAEIIAGRGDDLAVSQLPLDGSYPTATSRWEKRNLAEEIPVWDEELCIHCGKCPFVCPHSVIRSKVFDPALINDAPATFKHVPVRGKGFPKDWHISYQIAPEDCTGCGLCVEICPAKDKKNPQHRALNMAPYTSLKESEKGNWAYFEKIPEYDRRPVRTNVIKEAMLLQPLFEFPSACPGCGETPYIRLATQLFGDRMVVANATGCSSIYGGNLPTTPWSVNNEGRGPAWNNSLFEDNAEFGLGMRLAIDKQREQAEELLQKFVPQLSKSLIKKIYSADQSSETGIYEQRERVEQIRKALKGEQSPEAKSLISLADNLVKRSVWIIGGDGWAYDIGFGGLDHVLASGKDVNILVLDTEVYSNTGGQTSKATPKGAVAKFSAAGKPGTKKDLAMIAMSYENVYVAQVAYGNKDIQTLRAFIEAESYPGTSIIIAYAPCIAWGNDLANNHQMQDLAVNSGHWPLLRYDPRKVEKGENPLKLDSKAPSVPYEEFVKNETRFSMLWRTHPDAAEKMLKESQHDVDERYNHYKTLSELSNNVSDK
ncbi:MAG: pyruvate:ferredoxin (flavodoxin) oxidoreductase [gamma proteobacterium symbiont of Taylorina sp.]|nr:pyruvate:ferredoxin (flavodoxin) oxidoreductase [gamma proteobacterium symbiont of Taylorina sp.]